MYSRRRNRDEVHVISWPMRETLSSDHLYGKGPKTTAAHEKDVRKLNVKALPHVRILSLSDTFVRQQSNSKNKNFILKVFNTWQLQFFSMEMLSLHIETVYMVALVFLLTCSNSTISPDHNYSSIIMYIKLKL